MGLRFRNYYGVLLCTRLAMCQLDTVVLVSKSQAEIIS